MGSRVRQPNARMPVMP